jgi:hypothetical protein
MYIIIMMIIIIFGKTEFFVLLFLRVISQIFPWLYYRELDNSAFALLYLPENMFL